MDFKHKNDRNKTPKSKIIGKVLNTVSSDSPFRSLPNFSTPPSRFVKIFNPFDRHIIDRMHLPTLNGSPSVFSPMTSEEKFKWSIDEISLFKPADIDENTLDQHVFDEDPLLDSVVQEKINRFFSETIIVPSPINTEIKSSAVVYTQSPLAITRQSSNGSSQTVLSLPPKLPEHIEEALRPYFSYHEDQQVSDELNANSSLHRKLFEHHSPEDNADHSRVSSPALSTGLSPFQFSPMPLGDQNNISFGCPPDLDDCNLSPISRKSPKHCRSACRLDFSGRMSVDASLVVPDIQNSSNVFSGVVVEEHSLSINDNFNNTPVNWDMEYKQLSLCSQSSSSNSEKMEISSSTTPNSKLFTSQRKRLSESFKDEEEDKENAQIKVDERRKAMKHSLQGDCTDAGYLTGSIMFEESNWDPHVFASTPSKNRSQMY